ncbi:MULTISPECIES: hypothetical protein [Streptomyces]|uniref:Uncharacterized protein n=1 Tax=Streptomyces virginiae TaxID=1961 RepID=A0ABQ3NXG2_STRVG|nr:MULTISPECIES: hypothetical protein [Streptomyces]KOV39141.1 hypothetical protein ADK98_33285 [Streptomyces sp. H036]MBP2348892.1 hypothetical protein [Streptomyces virginiae]MCI4085594.1 hypothetical protein [Streptomyces sp. MMS21 TC-5]GGQ17872.1 hypothetical protein GCM10010215_48370 [Streptomyces virginiae]GHI17455.1 hypothetical protein Scinn_69180 [Streptomyces virginiae]
MTNRRQELTSSDLAAFDFLIKRLQESGQDSVNLRDLLLADEQFGGAGRELRRATSAACREGLVRHARRVLRQSVNQEELPDIEDLTLGQLDVEITFEKLLEARRAYDEEG